MDHRMLENDFLRNACTHLDFTLCTYSVLAFHSGWYHSSHCGGDIESISEMNICRMIGHVYKKHVLIYTLPATFQRNIKQLVDASDTTNRRETGGTLDQWKEKCPDNRNTYTVRNWKLSHIPLKSEAIFLIILVGLSEPFAHREWCTHKIVYISVTYTNCCTSWNFAICSIHFSLLLK